mmetsp:Transcript_106786/g.329870  ORF Transcript_106786/g.329870 Transcript_106786/m.329870 type:complete len:254 (-) Transcript_106786:177-938(-)
MGLPCVVRAPSRPGKARARRRRTTNSFRRRWHLLSGAAPSSSSSCCSRKAYSSFLALPVSTAPSCELRPTRRRPAARLASTKPRSASASAAGRKASRKPQPRALTWEANSAAAVVCMVSARDAVGAATGSRRTVSRRRRRDHFEAGGPGLNGSGKQTIVSPATMATLTRVSERSSTGHSVESRSSSSRSSQGPSSCSPSRCHTYRAMAFSQAWTALSSLCSSSGAGEVVSVAAGLAGTSSAFFVLSRNHSVTA